MNDHLVIQVRMIRRLLCAKTYKRLLTKARIGLGLLVASICLTTVCVTYTAGRHGAFAEAVRNIRRNYSGPAQQPEELEYRGTATFEGSGSHQ
jgi:hypothetical protein